MRRAPWTFLLSALAGCTSGVPLPDLPILGGTAAERDLVRSELVAFDQAVGEGRLRLVSFEFGEPGEGWAGKIRGQRITVLPGLDPDELRRVVRHELCHGLDNAERLTRDEPRALKVLEPGLLAGLIDPFDRDYPAIMEVMAHYCESGPYVAQVGAEPCDGDDPRLTALGTWLMEHVWAEYDAVRYELGTWVGRNLGEGDGAYRLTAYVTPDRTARFEHGLTEWIDLTTGTTAEQPSPSLVDTTTTAPVLPERPLTDVGKFEHHGPGHAYQGIALEDGGPWVGSYSLQWYYTNPGELLGASELRILGWDDEGWWIPADRCMRPGQGVFITADGVLWSSWLEGTELRWAPFVPR